MVFLSSLVEGVATPFPLPEIMSVPEGNLATLSGCKWSQGETDLKTCFNRCVQSEPTSLVCKFSEARYYSNEPPNPQDYTKVHLESEGPQFFCEPDFQTYPDAPGDACNTPLCSQFTREVFVSGGIGCENPTPTPTSTPTPTPTPSPDLCRSAGAGSRPSGCGDPIYQEECVRVDTHWIRVRYWTSWDGGQTWELTGEDWYPAWSTELPISCNEV